MLHGESWPLRMSHHTPSVRRSPHSPPVVAPWWRAAPWPCRREVEGAEAAASGAEVSRVAAKPASATTAALWPLRRRRPSPRTCQEGRARRPPGTALSRSGIRTENNAVGNKSIAIFLLATVPCWCNMKTINNERKLQILLYRLFYCISNRGHFAAWKMSQSSWNMSRQLAVLT